MMHSHPWKPNIYSAGQEIPCFHGTQNVYFHVHKSPSLAPNPELVESDFGLTHTFFAYVFQMGSSLPYYSAINKVIPVPWRHIRDTQVKLCAFLSSVLDGSHWLASHFGHFYT